MLGSPSAFNGLQYFSPLDFNKNFKTRKFNYQEWRNVVILW